MFALIHATKATNAASIHYLLRSINKFMPEITKLCIVGCKVDGVIPDLYLEHEGNLATALIKAAMDKEMSGKAIYFHEHFYFTEKQTLSDWCQLSDRNLISDAVKDSIGATKRRTSSWLIQKQLGIVNYETGYPMLFDKVLLSTVLTQYPFDKINLLPISIYLNSVSGHKIKTLKSIEKPNFVIYKEGEEQKGLKTKFKALSQWEK